MLLWLCTEVFDHSFGEKLAGERMCRVAVLGEPSSELTGRDRMWWLGKKQKKRALAPCCLLFF